MLDLDLNCVVYVSQSVNLSVEGGIMLEKSAKVA